jgi:hypothetical protein
MRVRTALARVDFPLLALWIALAAGLSVITASVRDWFAMTNELLYERRAISVAETLSPLPRLRGQLIASYDQLYPLLIAPVFRHGTVPHDLSHAHILNAWIMSSACIPVYLLARRVTGSRPAAYAAAFLAVCMPWILFASFLMTEVAAYPALLWALLASQRAAVAPSRRNDALVLLAIALAFFARTQFALLVFVVPLALLVYERGRVRTVLARHRLFAGTYVTLALVAVVLLAVGRLSATLGVYGDTLAGNLVPSGIGRSFVDHLAVVSLGVGILPLVAGGAWLVAGVVRPSANPEVLAFACIGAVFVLFQTLQVTIFDLRYSGDVRYVHDRYLLYLAPVLVLAFICALRDSRRPRWSIVLPAALVALGFGIGALPAFTWQQFETVNSDAPIAAFVRPVASFAGGLGGARALLAGGTLLLAVLFVVADRLLRRDRMTALFLALTLLALPALTAYMFVRLFRVNDWADRPITNPQPAVYDWVDARVGAGSSVSMMQYPVSSAFLVSQRVWRDYEFWNKSIDRDVQYGGPWFFKYTGDTFPQRRVRFDPVTGLAAASPTQYVLEADQETRFRVSGTAIVQQEGTELIDAARPWRTDWMTFGFYPDGWTQPGKAVRIRVFSVPGQRTARIRTLSVAVRAPEDVPKRTFSFRSDLQRVAAVATPDTVRETVELCVPAHGYTEVRLAARGSSTIPGDLRDYNLAEFTKRRGGIFVAEIALADEIGGPCKP